MAEELTTDVLVIGFGGAGASAAIVAKDAGADVVILEKLAEPGGNTRWSNCSWFCPPAGTEKDAIEHIDLLCLGRTPRDVIEAYVHEAAKTKVWIEGLGATAKTTHFLSVRYPQVTHPSWPNFPGASAMINYTVMAPRDNEPNGARLFGLLAEHVAKRGIKTITGAPAKDLLTDSTGAVIGARAEKDGQEIVIKARRAVVLTTGGFEFNDEMKERYLPLAPVQGIGSPGNTGDGIIMAEKIGASLWHMGVLVAGFGLMPKEGGTFAIAYPSPRFIYVNKHGKRFNNECANESHFLWQAAAVSNPKTPGYPTLPIYGLCDADTASKGTLAITTAGTSRDYKWSADNSAEIAKGWIIEGKTLAELATKLKMEPAVLEKSVARYNDLCKAGADTDFNRPKETLQPLDKPPFYAIEMWPRMVNTMGGPKRDAKARVIGKNGQPIGRLFSAGELGSLWGHWYCGGGNVGEALAVGRIAGASAAAEAPWC